MSVPSDQMQAFGGSQPTWEQISALATPPPMDDATINKLESQIPKPQLLRAPPAPMSPDQEAATKSDISGKQQGQVSIEKAAIDEQRASSAEESRLAESEISQMQNATPPAPPTQTGNPLQRMAPLLLLTAFGGKLTKLDANAMLGATMGTVNGYLQGNQEMYDRAQKQYEEAYQRFQEREKQRVEIEDRMREAYAERADAHQKALQMSYQLVGDEIAVDQDRLKAMDQWRAAVDKVNETNDRLRNEQYDRRARLEMARRKDPQNAEKNPPMSERAQQIGVELAKLGVNLPTGTRSAGARAQLLNGLAKEAGTPEQVAQGVRSGQIDMKVSMTEAAQVARREGNIEPSAIALTRPGGLYDQLISAAQKVDFGNSKTRSDVRIGLQKHVYANEDIQRYVTILEDTRADLTNVLARTGQATETVRAQAHNMFPDDMSLGELKTAVDASRKVTAAVRAGNNDVIEALKAGRSVQSVADQMDRQSGPAKTPISEARFKQYVKDQNTTPEKARAYLEAQGYEIGG